MKVRIEVVRNRGREKVIERVQERNNGLLSGREPIQEMQLTFEQHEFELCVSTYMQILFIEYMLENFFEISLLL